MNQLRTAVSALLDKVSLLLKSEPARAIGYGAAVVIFLVVRVLNQRGYVQFAPMSFEDSIVAATAAITVIGTVVESIRKFVYSPQTYIEDLSDEFASGHNLAHFEEELHAAMQAQSEAIRAEREAAKTTFVAPIGDGGLGRTDN